MARLVLPLLLLLSACRGAPTAPFDAGAREVAPPVVVDGGVAAAWLDAWLGYQAQVLQLPALGRGDGGPAFLRDEVRRRARAEQTLRADAGLSVEAMDAIEDVIAAVVAQRSIGRITGADAVREFERAAADLKDEQRAQALKALGELKARSQAGASLQAVRAKFGDEAVDAVLAREAEATRAWESLLEGKSPRR